MLDTQTTGYTNDNYFVHIRNIYWLSNCLFQPQDFVDPQNEEVVKEIIETMEVLEQTKKAELPPPHPPVCRKNEIYTDANVFDELDDKVIQVSDVAIWWLKTKGLAKCCWIMQTF